MAYNQAGEMRVNYYSSPTAYNKNIATGTFRWKKHELKYNDSPQQGEQREAADGDAFRCGQHRERVHPLPKQLLSYKHPAFAKQSHSTKQFTSNKQSASKAKFFQARNCSTSCPGRSSLSVGEGFFHQKPLISTLRDLDKLCPAWVHLCSHASISSRCKLSCNICTNSNSSSNSLTSTPSANNLTTTTNSNRFYLFS